jgi:hypothetical protein
MNEEEIKEWYLQWLLKNHGNYRPLQLLLDFKEHFSNILVEKLSVNNEN